MTIRTLLVPNITRDPQLDLADATILRVLDGNDVRICGIPNGTESGATVVAIMSPLPDGGWCMTEIKLSTLEFACSAIRAQCEVT